MYQNGQSKGMINAMPSILKKEDARLFFQDANPCVERKAKDKNGFEHELKFRVTEKRIFSYKDKEENEIVFIVADADLDS